MNKILKLLGLQRIHKRPMGFHSEVSIWYNGEKKIEVVGNEKDTTFEIDECKIGKKVWRGFHLKQFISEDL